ncbi:alpha/beta hydrolase [Actinoplanes sp. LDG1-06]|uniref:Alpha/beta hydrolase n=1 Tax=Paractinoplanes ovalisporus TaxID=2810368 RepID=A0ABS2ASL9_9ACTN|nr:alpha/beta hydrolase [Actinoplanes ovalisporus]MBM2622801.1 alpha/beta hydrolase [Actinoplanes ovalisporus]
MPTFASYDGTTLAYHVRGDGPVLVCLPGGPGRATPYMGDLGGLDILRALVMLDNRGTGESQVPHDKGSYRVDRLVEDVEALREHLGLPMLDLLAHSAGTNVATLYAAAHPSRVSTLTLVTGLLRVAGLTWEDVEEGIEKRSGEPWYAAAMEADAQLEALDDDADPALVKELEDRTVPFSYGRWDATAQAHAAAAPEQFCEPARKGFWDGYDKDPAALAARLKQLTAPVLVVVGGVDLVPDLAASRAGAAFFPNSSVVTIPGAGHFPWLDDPSAFVSAVTRS